MKKQLCIGSTSSSVLKIKFIFNYYNFFNYCAPVVTPLCKTFGSSSVKGPRGTIS